MLNTLLESYIFLIPAGIFILYFLLKYPEISLALFINAYVIKGGINAGYFNLTAILLIVTVVGFILKQLFNKDKNTINFNFKFQPSDKYILFFIAVLAIGCIYSLNRNGGIIKALRFIVIVFVPYLLTRIFLVKGTQIKLFLTSISIIALVIGFLLILKSMLGGYSGGRVNFFYANPIPVGTLFMLGLPIFIVGMTQNMFNKNKYGKFFFIIAIVLLLYSLFLIATRGPLISMMIGLIFYFVIIFRKKVQLKNVGVITIILLSLIFIWISYSDIICTNPVINKIIPNVNRLSISGVKELSGRVEIYSDAWQLFKNKPLFGIGTGGFPGGYPHNIFLEIAVENGLLGLMVFFGFLFAIGQKGYQFLNENFIKINKQAKIMSLIILVIAVSLFAERQFSFGLDMHKDLFVFFGLIVNLPFIDWGRC